MILSFAPMEGVTSAVFRRVHRRYFPEADLYYSPFIAPDSRGEFKTSRLRDLLGENNEGVPLVPQILAGRPEAFLGAARRLAELGYDRVDLNLGCPSATVVSKHKGSGLLGEPEQLDALLADIFSRTPVSVSIKTRLGFSSTDEIDDLMEIFNRYPITCLTVHARCREGFYKSPVDLDAFSRAFASAKIPVVYNGNIFTPRDYQAVTERFPSLNSVMIGRGAAADPALFRTIRGGPLLCIEELKTYHRALIDELLSSGLSEHFTTARMKELWFYLRALFPEEDRAYKAIVKSRNLSELVSSAERLFSSGQFDPSLGFPGG